MLDQAEHSESGFEGAMLVLEQDSGPQRFPLEEDRVTIGRSHVCDLCVDEPSISSEHARLVRTDGVWRVVNLLSTNGVYVNGEKTFSCQLHDGDEIRLGRTRLMFHNSAEPTPSDDGPSPNFGNATAILIATAFVGIAAAAWLLLR
ncbi:MAG: FHA domain-containing protein [Wenzhouxiangellaceae bacterium]